MWSTRRIEVVVNAILGGLFTVVTTILAWLIKNETMRSVVLLCGFIGIFLIFVGLPYLTRLIRAYIYLHSDKGFRERSSIQHQMMHEVRDTCVKMLPPVEVYSAPLTTDADNLARPNHILAKNKDQIVILLERMVELFLPLVPPGTKVWASIRDRRADDCYHTFARAGRYNPNRQYTSVPLHKDKSRVIKRLKDNYEDMGDCVMITGSSQGQAVWERRENDTYGEDKSVLLGAVLTRSWDRQSNKCIKPKLAWIVGISADQENAFSKMHIPLMKQCVDMFSLLANVMIRCEH